MLNCDEYPFKTTLEGAAFGDNNYSARVIDAKDNQRAGSRLGVWFGDDHILDQYHRMTPEDQSPLDVVDELFIVEYNRFNLIDAAGPEPGDPDPSETILFGEDWVCAGPGWLALGSGGQDHLASVRLEAWVGTPPDTDQEWERSTEVPVRFRSARVQLSRFTGGPSEQILQLSPGPDYRAQVHVRGRSRAAQAHLETVRTGELPSGLERWLMRIQPVPA